jgi:hypothetical protein
MPDESRGLQLFDELAAANTGGFSDPGMEYMFKRWHGMWALQTGNRAHPDSDPNYDWRAAFLAGAKPSKDKDGNWVWPGDFMVNRATEGNRTPLPNYGGSSPPVENAPWERPNVPYPLAKPRNRSGLPYSI